MSARPPGEQALAELAAQLGGLELSLGQMAGAVERRLVELENALPEDQLAGNLEFLNGAGHAESLAVGPAGAEGPAGPAGEKGPAGASAKMGKPSEGVAGPAAGVELEPSAVKDALVTFSIALEPATAATSVIVSIFVDGLEIKSLFLVGFAGTLRTSVTFGVPAKSKWKWKLELGAASANTRSYTFFG
jgi:hypothetical protein